MLIVVLLVVAVITCPNLWVRIRLFRSLVRAEAPPVSKRWFRSKTP